MPDPSIPTNTSPLSITRPKQLLVEGIDDYHIFIQLLNCVGITDVEVQHYGGKRNFRAFLNLIKEHDDYGLVESIGVHRDADEDARAAGQSVRDALRDFHFPVPMGPIKLAKNHGEPSTAYIIVPHGDDRGAMEEVCLASIKQVDLNRLKCVVDHFECINKLPDPPRNSAKSKIYTYLASIRDPGLRIREAARASVWDFDSDAFRPLKDFIRLL